MSKQSQLSETEKIHLPELIRTLDLIIAGSISTNWKREIGVDKEGDKIRCGTRAISFELP